MTQAIERRERGIIAKRCRAIRSGYLEREERQAAAKSDRAAAKFGKVASKPDKTDPVWDSKLGYLKIETYALARQCIERGWGRHIQRMGDEAAIASQRKHGGFDDDPFHWTLLAIEGVKPPTARRVDRKAMVLPQSTRSRIAKELGAADRCRVPVEFLLGFIWQAGGANVCGRWTDRSSSEMFDRFSDPSGSYVRK